MDSDSGSGSGYLNKLPQIMDTKLSKRMCGELTACSSPAAALSLSLSFANMVTPTLSQSFPSHPQINAHPTQSLFDL
eukprot:10272191-Karenia_brevis.AAC.1